MKNYTLFLGLVTSVRDLAKNKRTMSDAMWLQEFFQKHAKSLIQPHASSFGVAEQVVDELQSVSPSIREGRSLFDPSLLTDIVLRNRTYCVEEWLLVMKQATDEHLELERKLLEERL